MSYLKRTIALMLVVVMVVALAACGKKETTEKKEEVEHSKLYQNETRVINVGTWYEVYYTSAHNDVYDQVGVEDLETALMNLNNMRTIEQKYNIELYYYNMTWNGVIESIQTSIMAGKPDNDVYMVDLQFGIPAVVNGYCMPLEKILDPENNGGDATDIANAALMDEKYKDVFSEKGSDIVKTLKFTPGGTFLFTANSVNLSAYALGYNKELIDNHALADPQELAKNKQWTWDEWLKDMIELTDSDNEQWGFRGPWTTLLTSLLLSNNASIASGTNMDSNGKVVEGITSENTTEVLKFLADMYNTYHVSFWDASCDNAWDDNVFAWAQGNIGFWVAAAWISQSADPDQNMLDKQKMVTWPVGPHGNADTNKSFNETTGTYYMIPVGVENPQLIYCVMYDYWNWYNNDLSLRDDEKWFATWCYTPENLETIRSMADSKDDLTMELWDQVDYDENFQIRGLIETGTDATHIDVSEFQAANKQLVQAYLDKIFNKNS